jgi:hypothetical protein
MKAIPHKIEKLPMKHSSWKTISRIGALFLILSWLSGCANSFTVQVNAIAKSNQPDNQQVRYVLVSGMSKIDQDNLFYREYSAYFDHVLQSHGYTKVKTRADANMEIRFEFGMSEGRPGLSMQSWPIYETTGPETVTITERASDGSSTTRTLYIPPRITRVGTSTETRSYTLFTHVVNLQARPLNAQGEAGEVQWMIQINSTEETNDQRLLMPYMAAAMRNFIAINSGQQTEVTILFDDPYVLELKGLLKAH